MKVALLFRCHGYKRGTSLNPMSTNVPESEGVFLTSKNRQHAPISHTHSVFLGLGVNLVYNVRYYFFKQLLRVMIEKLLMTND